MPQRSNSVAIRRMMRQPGWWAAVSSLGFHGLLFALLPLLPAPPSFGDDIDSRTVSVFELSSTDTERLPTFLESELSLPPLPDAPAPEGQQTPELEPYKIDLGPNIIESQRQFEQAPRSSASYDFSNVFPNLPDPSVFERRQSVVIPPAPPQRQQPQRQQPQPPATTPIEPASPDSVDELPGGRAADLEPPSRETPPDERIQAPFPNANRDAEPAEPQGPIARGPDQPEPQSIELSPEQQAAYEQLYTYNPNRTESDKADVAAVEWLVNEIGRDIGELPRLVSSRLRISIDYPEDACAIAAAVNNRSLPAYYGVMLDEDGAVASEPALIRSSGFGVLNLEGRGAVAGRTFEGASGPKLIQVEFVYSDATCSASEAIARDEAGQN